jgi:hypothetical protein
VTERDASLSVPPKSANTRNRAEVDVVPVGTKLQLPKSRGSSKPKPQNSLCINRPPPEKGARRAEPSAILRRVIERGIKFMPVHEFPGGRVTVTTRNVFLAVYRRQGIHIAASQTVGSKENSFLDHSARLPSQEVPEDGE